MEYSYTSTETRIYADRALQVEFGDVVDWPDGPPADGHWQPTEATQVELDRLEQERAEQAKTEEPPPGGEQQNTDSSDGNADASTDPSPQSTGRGRKTTKE